MQRPDGATQAFEAQRPRLLRLAYRMLGSMSEAEDVVQDAWLRWSKVDPAHVETPAAFLSRTVTRLCLDVMKSARARRETYVGAWLPEPLVETEETPAQDNLTLTLMMALERLSPLERAAFLLHDVFDVEMNEVAATLDRDPAAIRQLASRARKHVKESRPRYTVENEEGARIARAFFIASRNGDVATLSSLLAKNAVLHSDGGGKVLAFLNPITGINRLLRLYRGLSRKYKGGGEDTFRPARIDGLPGYTSLERDDKLQTTALQIADGRITHIYITRNPDKLRHVSRAMANAKDKQPHHLQ
ncbi:MAG: sigma-70 family RNA polymerase sigma factor [Xanthobacteraceae bacterium]|nr:sigma-70 family RNA polymerase sigma factor [Xanthobacteraceae bacterium]